MKPLNCMLRLILTTYCFLTLLTSIVNGQQTSSAQGGSPDYSVVQYDDGSTKYIYPWDKSEYPNPVTQHRYCRMPVVSNVCDPDDVLTFEQKIDLDKLTRKLHSELKCYCTSCAVDSKGIAVGVALMHSIHRPYAVEPKNNTKDFADHLRRTWNLGSCGNDLIILVTTQDRMWSPSFGETAKRVLPTQVLDRLTTSAQEAFYNKNFYQGLSNLLRQLFNELDALEREANRPKPIPKNDPKKSTSLLTIIILTVIGILALALIVTVVAIFIVRRKRNEREQDKQRDEEAAEKLKKNPDNDHNNDTFLGSLKEKLSFKKQGLTPVPTSKTGVVEEGVPIPERTTNLDEVHVDLEEGVTPDPYQSTVEPNS